MPSIDTIVLSYNYNSRNWFQYTRYSDTDEDFRADLGFITQVNTEKYVFGGGRNWFSETAWWNRIEVGGDWDISHDQEGRLLERELEGRVVINGPWQSTIAVGRVIRARLFDDILFDEEFFFGRLQATPRRGLELQMRYGFGDRIDFDNSRLGENVRLSPRINYSLNRHTQIALRHNYDRIKVDGLRERVANLTDFRVIYQFNQRSFLRLTAQIQNIKSTSEVDLDFGAVTRDRDFNKQLLYSYKLNPRAVFFLGYSDLADSDDDRPNYQTQQRGLFMKLGYVFNY